MKILIVDDDPVSLAKLNVLLEKYGQCDTAFGGTDAKKKFETAHREYEPYNLIFLDIDMPDINGQELLEWIQNWENTNRVFEIDQKARIIMVTGYDDIQNLVQSFEKGCCAYITKPFNAGKIQESLDKLGIKPSG